MYLNQIVDVANFPVSMWVSRVSTLKEIGMLGDTEFLYFQTSELQTRQNMDEEEDYQDWVAVGRLLFFGHGCSGLNYSY